MSKDQYQAHDYYFMDELLSDEHKLIRDSARAWVKKEVSPIIDDYYEREVKPHLPNSWMDRNKDKIGYEINFTKYFYEYKPLRSIKDITKDLLKLDMDIGDSMKKILE